MLVRTKSEDGNADYMEEWSDVLRTSTEAPRRIVLISVEVQEGN